MKKIFSLIVTLLVALSFATGNVFAKDTGSTGSGCNAVDLPFLMNVEVEGVENPNLVNVERGDNLNVRVELMANANCEDVKVKAWIGGYEYDDIEDSTPLFDITSGVRYVKNLVLEIPYDIDAEESYQLHVEAFNDDHSAPDVEIPIQISAKRHSLNFVDVIFNPGLSVKSTQPLFVTVRVENLGQKKQDDVRVEVAIPELGISQRTFIDELVTVEESEDDDEETSSSSDTLLLDLSNVRPGTYNLRVKVDYNRGHDFIVQNFPLSVLGGRAAGGVEDLMVTALTSSMELNQGGSAVYTFSLANLGSESRTFNFEVTGQEAWAVAKAEPMAVTVLPDSTKEVKVTVNAKSDADFGSKLFTVKVRENDEVVQELQLEANVKQAGSSNLSSLKSGLEIGFIVLLVILVILGIILAVNKLKGKEEGGESYY